MSVTDYIENGMVQDYCLGLLRGHVKREFEAALNIYPHLMAEVELTQQTLENYAMYNGMAPPKELKSKIWSTLENLNREEKMDLKNLPIINKYSNHKKWLSVVQPLLPENVGEEKFFKVLQHNDKLLQMLTKSTTDFEDEVHDDLLESFIILEGECECYIGEDKVIRLGAGGYLEIPLHESHNVKVLSPYVVAVMQRQAV